MIQAIEELLELRQNATFNPCFVLTQDCGGVVNLTGATIRCQIRSALSLTSTLYLSFDSSLNNGSVVIGTTEENGETATTVTLFSPESANESLSFTEAYYQLKIIWADGTSAVVAYGGVTFVPGVTA